jgi:hypothetical protein
MNTNHDSTPIREYPLKDWISDWEWYFQMQSDAIAAGIQRMKRSDWDVYFQERYADDSFYSDRFGAAMSYLDRNIDAFNEGSIAIAGESVSAVGKPLMLALYRAYGRCPDNMLSHEFPASLILGMAKEHEDKS